MYKLYQVHHVLYSKEALHISYCPMASVISPLQAPTNRFFFLGGQRAEDVERPRRRSVRATVNSPTIRPFVVEHGGQGRSIQRAGMRAVSNDASQVPAPGPVTRYLAKLEISVMPTPSRTAATPATWPQAFERRKVTSSLGSCALPGTRARARARRPPPRPRWGPSGGRGSASSARPGGRQLLVRERDPESAPVVLLDLRARVAERRVGAVAGDVHCPDSIPCRPGRRR